MKATNRSFHFFMPRTKAFDETEVLTKAMELFWQQGYAATSVQDLITHLGISRASMYDTYGDKKSLYLKAFNHYRETNTHATKAFLSRYDDVKKGLLALFEHAIDDAACDQNKKGCFVVNTTTELVPNDPDFSAILQKNKTDFQQIFFEYLAMGQKQGQIKKSTNCTAAATLLFTVYNGLRVVTKIETDKRALQASISLVLDRL